MSGGVESDGRSADDTLSRIDDDERDPESLSDKPNRLSPVWTSADNLRKLLRDKGDPSAQKRTELIGALRYQLPTIDLYWHMGRFREAKGEQPKTVSLYILLFPGEGKDNTGIKDLNDKVIGQWWNSEFIRRRFEAIVKIFSDNRFMVVAQTYKTAYVMTNDGVRQDFIAKLAELDEALRVILLQILDAAEEDADKDKKKAIRTLRKKLKKNGYRFDIYFGFRTLKPSSGSKLENVYLLVTEALKGAAIARYAAKTDKVGKPFKKEIRVISPDPPKLDSRGKEFDWKTYMKVSDIAEKIKTLCVKGTYHSEGFLFVLSEIYIDTVWTVTFIERNGLYWGHPDVIRDVRKKKLQPPPMTKGNMTYSTGALKLLLETWLVVLNMVDFVKRFKTDEFTGAVVYKFHEDAQAVYLQVGQPSQDIDWPRLERVLTHDVRQHKRIAVFESASEFLFYSFASDHSQRIFFSMDVRDMGVELMLHYENSNREIVFRRLADEELMMETFRASDAIDERRRVTYDRVVAVFRKYYALLNKGAGGSAAMQAAFGTAKAEEPGSFEASAQIMLGGDEVYAAVHPQYAQYIHTIVGDLDRTEYDRDRTINLRTSVAFSSAKDATDPEGRKQVQLSHQEAMRLAEEAPATLKTLERARRRIERLIDMLEENPKKRSRAPGYRSELDKLPLMKLFARTKHGHSQRLPAAKFQALLSALRSGSIAAAEKTTLFELVDFNGTVVDGTKLERQAAALEDKVRRDVGWDNVRGHPPPVTKMPKWIDWLLEKWSPRKPQPKPGP